LNLPKRDGKEDTTSLSLSKPPKPLVRSASNLSKERS